MNKNVFLNGCSFVVNEKGQKVDSDGFKTSRLTYITNKRTCVSVKISNDKVRVRNTEDKNKVTTEFSHEEWSTFIKGVKDGEFDLDS